MARIKPLNTIVDIKLKTMEDIADASANEVIEQVRNKKIIKGKYSPRYAAFKRAEGRASRQTGFIDLTFDGVTLDSYMRLPSEATKDSQTVGFTNKEAENVAKGWANKKYNLFAAPVLKAINKIVDKRIDKNLKRNFDQASGRTTITIG
tara:strand:+ start:237 stop:683 length:447 start_codon:yes stop_codon:yes gene_type:complete